MNIILVNGAFAVELEHLQMAIVFFRNFILVYKDSTRVTSSCYKASGISKICSFKMICSIQLFSECVPLLLSQQCSFRQRNSRERKWKKTLPARVGGSER